jgi:hypothetical protein
MTDALEKKNAKKFYCQNCDFECCKKSNYEKHVLTPKHKNTDKILTNTYKKNATPQNIFYICNCGKRYKHRQSLFNHKKKCSNNEILDMNLMNEKKIIINLLQENNKLQNQIIELCKEKTITNINSNNKTFNLNVFLNETCKNAMNITDFVNSLQLQLSDLERVGELGYIEGISTIILKNLNALDITERPIHCTDKKRETMYIKDENKWEKEDDNKIRMHKMVKKITNKNIHLINEFREKYLEYKKYPSKICDKFNKIIIESMGGDGDDDYEKEEKIIKKVAKEVFIDKKY